MKPDSCKLSISIHDQVQLIQHPHLVAEPEKKVLHAALLFIKFRLVTLGNLKAHIKFTEKQSCNRKGIELELEEH